MQAAHLVGRDRARAEQFGQFAGADPAQQIHLEKTVLRMDEPGGVGEIETVASLQQRHPVVVACDADGGAKAWRVADAVELRHAGAQVQPGAQ